MSCIVVVHNDIYLTFQIGYSLDFYELYIPEIRNIKAIEMKCCHRIAGKTSRHRVRNERIKEKS